MRSIFCLELSSKSSDSIAASRFAVTGCVLTGLFALTPVALADDSVPTQDQIQQKSNASPDALEEVTVTARKERHIQEFQTDQTTKVLDQDQIKATSVVGGAARALALVPGVSTSTYGPTGSSKTTISIDGIKVGWAGFSGGNPDNGSIGVSFDGVPMNNRGNGLWQATLVPRLRCCKAWR